MKKLIWGILSGLFILSCSNQVQKAEIVYADGVKIVKNPLLEVTMQDLEPELVINEGESDEELFSNLSDIVEDKDGNIYISDEAENNIKVYTQNGKFIKIIGREGEGPGEFRQPVCLDFFSDGRLVVADQGNQRFLTFDSNGEFIESFKIDNSAPGHFIISEKDELYNKPRMIFIFGDEVTPLFYKYDNEFNQIAAIGKVIDQGETFKTHVMAAGSLAQVGDDICLAFSMLNKINIYSDSTLVGRIERQLNYVPEKPEVKTIQDGDSITMTAVIDPVCYDIDIDSKGYIYILTPATSSYADKKDNEGKDPSELYDTLLEIFTPEGEILKSIPLKGVNGSNIYIGKNDKLYFLDVLNMQVLRYPAFM